jgi:dihydroorotate dehydrogenase
MKPWLLLPPKWAHDLGPWVLPIIAKFCAKQIVSYRPFHWRGLRFENPIGLAGGADKSGASLLAWQKLGVGFLEVGTITPHAQKANPGQILDRDKKHKAVWNKMGFPNAGMLDLKTQLQKISKQRKVPLFINIGKNRTTPNEKAAQDYIACLHNLYEEADGFVINISSPNTQDLRDLLKKENLENFLKPLLSFKLKQSQQKPFLLKLSPDMEPDSLISALETSLALNIDGWILTNTTLSRPANLSFPSEGGVSGAPLCELAFQNLLRAAEYLKNKKGDRLLISTGGIFTANEAQRRLDAGADLVQIYSALIFEGPLLFQKISAQLANKEPANAG